MLDDLITIKEEGVEKMHAGENEAALELFSKVINTLNPETDDEALLKSICYFNRSTVNLKLKNIGDAYEDAALIVAEVKYRRPKLKIALANKEDKLMKMYALAEMRKGDILASMDDIMPAIQSYTLASKLSDSVDASSMLYPIFYKLGFPPIDETDPDLCLFSQLMHSIASEVRVLTTLGEILTLFQDPEISPEWIEKIRTNCCHLFLYGTIQLYLDNDIVCQASICILRNMAECGVTEVFEGILVLRNLLAHQGENNNVMSDMYRLLRLTPDRFYIDLEINDFIEPLLNGLRCKLTTEEYDAAFYILFQLIKSKTSYQLCQKYYILDYIFKTMTKSSIPLLSKLCFNDELCEEAVKKDAVALCIAVLKKVEKDDLIITSALITLSRVLVRQNPDVQKYAGPIVLTVVPVLTKHSKEQEIIASGFSCLICAAPFAAAEVRASKAVRLASIILSLYRNDLRLALKAVSFLYAAASAGCVAEVVEVRALLPTVMECLTTHLACEEFAEKAVGLAALCGFPKTSAVLAICLRTHPNSEFLRKLSDSSNK